ncbi:MAG: hypothetical protein JO270_19285 [Acidobacteriaceae bacterium]|nr:hypothetical protein [Acidobacteriaceae bacterium]MBV8570302.1 hypothetical protein [Acidobacteriaceae bacterium]
MQADRDEEVEFFESELDVCHALLDIAGPKPVKDLIAKARLGYENALQWIGTVRDPSKLGRIRAKLDRLGQRLSRTPALPQPAANGLRV